MRPQVPRGPGKQALLDQETAETGQT